MAESIAEFTIDILSAALKGQMEESIKRKGAFVAVFVAVMQWLEGIIVKNVKIYIQ